MIFKWWRRGELNDNYPFVICKLQIILNGENGKNGRLEGCVYKTCTKSRRNSNRIHLCPSLKSTLLYAKSIRAPRTCTSTFYTNLRCVDYPSCKTDLPGVPAPSLCSNLPCREAGASAFATQTKAHAKGQLNGPQRISGWIPNQRPADYETPN
jgi:hypothetical protein